MDRRIRKTRTAIFSAFIDLLGKWDYQQISVQMIIDQADVGRSTFYNHFETKDLLLEKVCADLFNHIFPKEGGQENLKDLIEHLFRHVQDDQNHIKCLLLSNNPYVIREFQKQVNLYLLPLMQEQLVENFPDLPNAYLAHLASSHLLSSLTWWQKQNQALTYQDLAHYYLTSLQLL